jgi:hypothetical protein
MSANDSKKAQHILKKWSVELKEKDRTYSNISSNFDELFYELWRHSIPFQEVEKVIKDAVAAHMPNAVVAKMTFKKLKSSAKFPVDEQEFMKNWKKDINDKAYQSFYAIYDIDGESEQEDKPQFGSMSAREYRVQRKYANSFPLVDLKALEQASMEAMKEDDDDVEVHDG